MDETLHPLSLPTHRQFTTVIGVHLIGRDEVDRGSMLEIVDKPILVIYILLLLLSVSRKPCPDHRVALTAVTQPGTFCLWVRGPNQEIDSHCYFFY